MASLEKIEKTIRELITPRRLVEKELMVELPAASAYVAGDVIASTATNTEGRAWLFKNMARVKGGGFYIVKAVLNSETESIVPRIALHLYSKEPVGERDDNAAAVSPQPTDYGNFKGEIVVNAMTSRGDNSYSLATPGTAGNLPYPFVCEPESRDLYVEVIAIDGFTQTATDTLRIQIIADQY